MHVGWVGRSIRELLIVVTIIIENINGVLYM